MLKERLRQALIDQAQTGNRRRTKNSPTASDLNRRRQFTASARHSRLLMKDDVAADRPMLAALCVSKLRPGIPARGFFLAAEVLGVFSGNPTGPEARAFHADELLRVLTSMEASARTWCLLFRKEGNRDPRRRANPAGDHELL